MDKETFKKAEQLDAIITSLENIKDRFEMTGAVNFAWEGLDSHYKSEFYLLPKEYNKMVYDLLMNELEKVKQEFKEL